MPSVGLIKAANSCLKRVLGAVKKNGKCDCAKDASQLDNLVERLNEVSPAVDEVVLCLYPPITKEAVRENVSNNRLNSTIFFNSLFSSPRHLTRSFTRV